MPVRVSYKGVALEFERPPTPPQIKAAYEQYLANQTDSGSAETASQAAPVTQPSRYPLSAIQESLWFLYELEEETIFSLVRFGLRLKGRLDIPAFHRAILAVVERHAILRTVYGAEDGVPYQRVLPTPELALPVHDLTAVAPEQQEQNVLNLATEQASKKFDLRNGPVIRAALAKLADDSYVALFTIHHIAFDGPSEDIFVNDLVESYQTYLKDVPQQMDRLPIQYHQFAQRQREQLKTALPDYEAYWREKLSGDLPTLNLPTDRLRPPLQSFNGTSCYIMLDDDVAQGVFALGRQHSTTVYMTLLTAFYVLLHRYTGQQDLIVGTPVTTRRDRDMRGLVGCFVNLLVLRANLWGDPTFAELLSRVRLTAIDGFQRQTYPFASLVRLINPPRDPSRPLVFQASFGHQYNPFLSIELPELTLTSFEYPEQATEYELIVEIQEHESQLGLKWQFNTDLFDPATIQRMAAQFQTLLRHAIADAGQPISRLPLIPDSELVQLRDEWNRTQRSYPHEQGAHQLVAAYAARTPEAIAVSYEGQSLSYAELDRRANQLAQHLRALGVKQDVLVGIFLERSLELIVSLLAVHKAGGAYVPLDPAYPQERLAYMLRDAQPLVVITQQSLLHAEATRLPSHSASVVCIDDDAAQIAQQPTVAPKVDFRPEQLAYVIYTSGSTGQPKGVQIPQQALVNLLTAFQAETGLSTGDTLFAITTLSFDIAGLELFLPLIVGAQLVIAPRSIVADAAQLGAAIDAARATYMQATPATWRLLIDAGWSPAHPLKALCGGEALPLDLMPKLLKLSQRLWNVYGPTETTIWSTAQELRAADAPVTIGRPIANTQVYVLDPRLQPVPIGVPGELYIGGDGVARGYRGRPDLTAERFVPDPFSAGSGLRMYRTGDLVRYRPDGALEFLSRIDQQVKIRGFRIELEEIEVVLSDHPAVRQCVVVDRADRTGQKQLVAYVIADLRSLRAGEADQSLSGTLRSYLQERLPPYMIPSLFATLDELPLTPSGKVDRKALRETTEVQAEPTVYVAPRTNAEREMARIWSEVMGVEKVGIHDDFFDLGGHSLIAGQLIARLRSALGVDMALRTFFNAPTIAELSEVLQSRQQLTGGAGNSSGALLSGEATQLHNHDRESRQQGLFDKHSAWVFPGQGTQVVGMGRDVYETSAAARAVFDEANAVLGFDLARLCFEGPVDMLTQTENAQPALLTTSIALLAAARERSAPDELPQPLYLAGHSLGEYTALVVAGSLSFATALRLVRRRGELMAAATNGAMGVLMGIDLGTLYEVCADASADGMVVVANENAPDQLVISGTSAGVKRALALAKERGAQRARPLNVSAAFHSPLMSQAASGLQAALNSIEDLSAPQRPVISNVSAEPLVDAAAVRAELVAQVVKPVRWIASVERMIAAGVRQFVEIGPGTVLTRMITEIAPQAEVMNVHSSAAIDQWLQQHTLA